MDLSGFLRVGSLVLYMSASLVNLVRQYQTRPRSNGKAWLSIRGMEGSFRNELIMLWVTSHYLRAVVLLINWVLYLWNTRERSDWHDRSRSAWLKTSKERSRWRRSADDGAPDWCYNYSIYFKCVAYTSVASPVMKSHLRHWHTTTICVLQHLVIIIPGIHLKS